MASALNSSNPAAEEIIDASVVKELKAPVRPVDLDGQFEEGVLFSDPRLSLWWWDTHAFLTTRQKYDLVRQVLPRCSAQQCLVIFKNIRKDLEEELEPTPTGQALLNGVRSFGRERPYFLAASILAVAYLLISAGANLYGLVTKLH